MTFNKIVHNSVWQNETPARSRDRTLPAQAQPRLTQKFPYADAGWLATKERAPDNVLYEINHVFTQ
ncbi:hypothetical protein J6590_039934 [Homalodisca vitripennis]|nr:hypothetical protein J6590_039934 [Homalodisca vitripennis]